TITYTNSKNATGLSGARAQLAVGCTHANLVTSGRMQDRLSRYFNTACFTTPPVVGDDGRATAFGNSGASIVNGPGQANVDMSLLKKIPIKENKILEFRAEFFNVFNSPQFNAPDTNFSFGTEQLDLGPTIRMLDSKTREDGFHVLQDWDGKAEKLNDEIIPVDVLNFLLSRTERRRIGDSEREVLAILLEYYFIYVLV